METREDGQIRALMECYMEQVNVEVQDYVSMKARLSLPIVSQSLLAVICDRACNIFENETMLVRINESDVVVVGSLHGQLLDLFRILNRFGFPPSTKYLFLGDFIDDGEFSTEVITILFVMKILFPESVYLIRGNHEFSIVFQQGGFGNELSALYGNSRVGTMFFHTFASCLLLQF